MFIRFKLVLLCILTLAGANSATGQNGFFFPAGVESDRIDFELVNNLVVIPVEVNGTPLSFILDTGVRTTILFGLSQNDSIRMNNVEAIKVRGLGEGGAVDALKSRGNHVRVGLANDYNHTIYIVFDASLNFSPRMGIPIHGIMGYDFYRRFVVETQYGSKRISFHDPKRYRKRKCRRCQRFPIILYNGKPHLTVHVTNKGREEAVTLLVDSGSSDALWLFDEELCVREEPPNYFQDFLGLGLSGNIFGKRSRIDGLSLGPIELNNVNVAVPDQEALSGAGMYAERDGSLGGGVLKRFTVVMDYASGEMSLRKNSLFGEPFYYNMSGLTVELGEEELVRGTKKIINNPLSYTESDQNAFAFGIIRTSEFSWEWAKELIVAEVREGSPAGEAGLLKGDKIIAVNGRPAYQMKMYRIMDMFSSKPGRKITLDIVRNGIEMKKQFVLRDLLE
jgi:hypothetical protein